jgi:dTDP-4-dehydrorhamnose reductase
MDLDFSCLSIGRCRYYSAAILFIMKKILVTGASGFLGYHLLPMLCKNYSVDAIYYRQKFELPHVNWHKLNLLEEKELKQAIETIRPDAIIHAAAISNPNVCEEHVTLSHYINVYATVSIAQYCKSINIPLIFISTDLVFNGTMGDYSENDFCFPVSKYGTQKLEAEEFINENEQNSLICRLPLLFGIGPEYSINFLGDWLKKLADKEEIIAFSDEFRSTISVNWAARGIVSALAYMLDKSSVHKEKIFHLGGPECISRYNFARLIADVFGFDDKNIVPKLRSELPMPAPRPENVSLNSSLASDVLQFCPPALSDQLFEIKNSIKHV